jgi:DNA-binding GntR family transcriptional regulator
MGVNKNGRGAKRRRPEARPESQWEAVYRETRRRILTLELAPGTPLSEITVAQEFGTSPTPARDALGRLRQEGLVVLARGRRYSVAGLSINDISELSELRFVLESGIAQIVLRRAAAERLAHVREVAATLEAPGLTFTELIERNQDFHLAVAEMSDNARLVDALRRVLEDSKRIFHLGITALPVREMVETHRTLVDAIERGDLETAVHVCDVEAFGTAERVVGQLMRGAQVGGRHVSATATR